MKLSRNVRFINNKFEVAGFKSSLSYVRLIEIRDKTDDFQIKLAVKRFRRFLKERKLSYEKHMRLLDE